MDGWKKKQFRFTFSINRSNHNSKIRVRVQFKTILKRKLLKFMFLFSVWFWKGEICIMRVGPRSWRVNGLVTRAGSIHSRTTRGPINRQSVLAYSYKRRDAAMKNKNLKLEIWLEFVFFFRFWRHIFRKLLFRQMKSSKSQLLLVSRLYVTPIQVSKGFNIKMK